MTFHEQDHHIRVTEQLAWEADQGGWDERTTHVDGHLTDGTELDIVTAGDHDLPRRAEIAARESWLHGKVLTAHVGEEGAETLVVPTSDLAPVVIEEAVRRRGYGHIQALD